MKITTKKLRRIIREELQKINENPNSSWYKQDVAYAAMKDWIEKELELADDPGNEMDVVERVCSELKADMRRYFKNNL